MEHQEVKEQLFTLLTEDNATIALWKVSNPSLPIIQHIFLTHGTFSDKRICMGIAKYFVAKGYICWIMEWRDHGKSGKVSQPFNFETVALYDLKTAFHHLLEKEKIASLHCITHSGGGICLTMYLIQNQVNIPKVKSIALFGCQVFGAATTTYKYIGVSINKYFTKLIGFTPGRLGGKPHNESYFTMKQWFDWNLGKHFKGANDFDYLPRMKKVTVPIISVAAEGDKQIAPEVGCRSFLAAFENPKNKLLFCAKANGNLEDYDHGRILLSRNAAKEIYPQILDWFEVND